MSVVTMLMAALTGVYAGYFGAGSGVMMVSETLRTFVLLAVLIQVGIPVTDPRLRWRPRWPKSAQQPKI